VPFSRSVHLPGTVEWLISRHRCTAFERHTWFASFLLSPRSLDHPQQSHQRACAAALCERKNERPGERMSRNALARPWIRSRSGGFALFCAICWSEMTAHVKITRMRFRIRDCCGWSYDPNQQGENNISGAEPLTNFFPRKKIAVIRQ
jgi:hypothetical protein